MTLHRVAMALALICLQPSWVTSARLDLSDELDLSEEVVGQPSAQSDLHVFMEEDAGVAEKASSDEARWGARRRGVASGSSDNRRRFFAQFRTGIAKAAKWGLQHRGQLMAAAKKVAEHRAEIMKAAKLVASSRGIMNATKKLAQARNQLMPVQQDVADSWKNPASHLQVFTEQDAGVAEKASSDEARWLFPRRGGASGSSPSRRRFFAQFRTGIAKAAKWGLQHRNKLMAAAKQVAQHRAEIMKAAKLVASSRGIMNATQKVVQARNQLMPVQQAVADTWTHGFTEQDAASDTDTAKNAGDDA